MRRTQIIAVGMIAAVLLGQAAAIAHFHLVPHRIGPSGRGVHSAQNHGGRHGKDGAPSDNHSHRGGCFALKWLTAPQTDLLPPALPVWLIGPGAQERRRSIGPSGAVYSIDVLSVSPSQSPPARA